MGKRKGLGQSGGKLAQSGGKAAQSGGKLAQAKKAGLTAKTKKRQIATLVVALVAVMVGGVIFMGAVSGWFGETKVTLSPEYYCKEECDGGLTELSVEEYETLVDEKKSFIVVIDQAGCTTAERIKEYASRFAKSAGVRIYRMMFSEMKKTSLYEKVRYYPSVAVISGGKVVAYLRADSDEDAGAYNEYEAFEGWMKRYL